MTRDLIAKLEALDGPDPEMDHFLADVLDYPNVHRFSTGRLPADAPVPAFTASLDAATALVERVLPGWSPSIGQNVHHKYWHGTVLQVIDGEIIGHAADHASPAIALLIALLRAKEARDG